MKITDLNHILAEAERIITKAVPIIAEANRRGGYLCVASGDGHVHSIVQFGEIMAEEKAQRYIKLCQEKALRLAAHPRDVSSWQSRDVAADRMGGAVRVGHLIYSFSGLPELWDEACMIALAKAVPMANIDASYWQTVASMSKNPYSI